MQAQKASAAVAALDKWKFPVLKTVLIGTPRDHRPPAGPDGKPSAKVTLDNCLYSVVFYPYVKKDDDPVFAVVGGIEAMVLRYDAENGVQMLQYFIDDNKEEILCTSCWTKGMETGDPLLIIAGNSAIIKVLNVITGKVVQTLIGHGDEIMEVKTSPADPTLLASASADSTVRIWSLNKAHQGQPCACICSGEGHRETVLTLAFHDNGRYLLSGGMDHIVNLWILPQLPNEQAGTDKPNVIVYPHFSSSLIHSNYIDSIAFHGDLIVSKAAKEHKIVVWKIQNFSSKDPILPQTAAPTTHEWADTRSAYGGGYERLFQLHCPDTEPFFLHFGLLSHPNVHPMVAVGGTTGKIYLWNLRRIENLGKDANASDGREGSVEKSASGWGGKKHKEDPISDPFSVIKAHAVMDIPRVKTTIREIGWSRKGDYMVAVGDGGMIAVFKK